MNKSMTKDVRMFGATEECLNQNQSKWENIAAIAHVKRKISQHLMSIKDLDQKKSASASNPVTVGKDKMREMLEAKSEVLKGIVLSYAYANNRSDLVKKVELLAKGFSKKRETEIEPNVNAFLEIARELQPQLADYNLTEEMIVDVEETCREFAAMVGAPRSMVVQSSSANKQLDKLVKETRDLLIQQLDNLMLRFKTSDAEFFNSYIQSRIIVEPATRHRDKPEESPVAP